MMVLSLELPLPQTWELCCIPFTLTPAPGPTGPASRRSRNGPLLFILVANYTFSPSHLSFHFQQWLPNHLLPASLLDPLRSILHISVREIFLKPKLDHVPCLLKALQRLSDFLRIKPKLTRHDLAPDFPTGLFNGSLLPHEDPIAVLFSIPHPRTFPTQGLCTCNFSLTSSLFWRSVHCFLQVLV